MQAQALQLGLASSELFTEIQTHIYDDEIV